MHGERQTIVSLLDAHSERSAKRGEFKGAIMRRIARTLMLSRPQLDPELARDIAIVLMHTMKTMAHLTHGPGNPAGPGVITELREMTRLYLANRFGEEPPQRPRIAPLA
jgi:hypothetical protein